MELDAMDYIDWDEGRNIPVEEDEPEAECTCIATDADMVNAAYCDLHGGAR